jgi:hypothetical protein
MIKDFKSFVFVSVDVKGLADAKFVSVDVKGVREEQRLEIWSWIFERGPRPRPFF